ncbi:MAG: MarR family transcriptional regulator [Dehalococcoidia bacterium]|nr:MarR family transcriptional regulator [Dehalococcoidia bacterium]
MPQPDAVHAMDDTNLDRLERLKHVARLYGDAVGIIDTLRIQGWSEGGLTLAQLRLLWSLRDEDGLPVGALAEQLGVNPSTITGHVDRLVRQDLVRREEDSVDRRIVRNYLTDDGRVIVTAVLQVAGAYIVNILRRLSEDDLDGLERSLTALNAAAAEARRGGA